MSNWRDLLDAIASDRPANARRGEARKEPVAQGKNPAEERSKLLEKLTDLLGNFPISKVEVLDALTPEAVQDWRTGKMTDDTIRDFAKSFICKKNIPKGEVPFFFTKVAECWHCGPVWVWPRTRRRLLVCPWCINHRTGASVPRPSRTCCRDCRYFARNATHPHTGRCDDGVPEPIAGWWDTDLHFCERFLPQRQGRAEEWERERMV